MISLFYITTNRKKIKFVIAALPDTRSIREPRALLQIAFYLVNLQDIVGPYPRAHLLIVEIKIDR